VVCFSVRGLQTEKLVIVAETAETESDILKAKISATVSAEFALSVEEIILVKSGQLPKTSSGKRQRRRTQRLYESGELTA
jgi:acyl-coenzyme A synthetase/AMP-(fatty) acid ligase